MSDARPFFVRRATRADAPAIAVIHVRSWQAAYRGLLPQDYLDALDPGRRQEQWEALLDEDTRPQAATLVVVEQSEGCPTVDPDMADAVAVSGFAVVDATRDTDDDPGSVGELQTLYLHPAVWRRGAGSLLLGAVHDHLRRGGFHSVSAWVLETNTGARLFYERHGWHPDGATRPHDWGAFVVTDVRYRAPLHRSSGGRTE